MKKRNLLFLYFVASLFTCTQITSIACISNNKDKEITNKLIALKDSFPQYLKEQQASYVLHFNTKTPYELYLDDILITHEKTSGISQTIQLNPYLLCNGSHTIKIRFLPTERSADGLLHSDDVVATKDYRWKVYFMRLKLNPNVEFLGYEGRIDYPSSELPVLAPPAPVPYWDQQWTVEINDLPYDLRGWRNGEDLSKLDQQELEKQVLAYYQKLRTMLNTGRITDFFELTSRQDIELAVATYATPEDYVKTLKKNMEDLMQECPNSMLPIDNYAMHLYAQGKIVQLEIPFGEFKHWGVLISDTKEATNSWGMMLYRPKGSKEFIPIR